MGSWTSVGLGVWLSLAPFALAYGKVGSAIYSDVILGIVIATSALGRALGPDVEGMADLSWIVAAGGLWVLIAALVSRSARTRRSARATLFTSSSRTGVLSA
jgi:SPW repeat-containing protein